MASLAGMLSSRSPASLLASRQGDVAHNGNAASPVSSTRRLGLSRSKWSQPTPSCRRSAVTSRKCGVGCGRSWQGIFAVQVRPWPRRAP